MRHPEDMQPLPYASTLGVALDLKAVDMMRDGLLHARARVAPDNVVVTHVWGPCPRCKDPIDVLQTHHSLDAERQSVGALSYLIDVLCKCDGPSHPGAPTDGGCGASFRLDVPFADPNFF